MTDAKTMEYLPYDSSENMFNTNHGYSRQYRPALRVPYHSHMPSRSSVGINNDSTRNFSNCLQRFQSDNVRNSRPPRYHSGHRYARYSPPLSYKYGSTKTVNPGMTQSSFKRTLMSMPQTSIAKPKMWQSSIPHFIGSPFQSQLSIEQYNIEASLGGHPRILQPHQSSIAPSSQLQISTERQSELTQISEAEQTTPIVSMPEIQETSSLYSDIAQTLVFPHPNSMNLSSETQAFHSSMTSTTTLHPRMLETQQPKPSMGKSSNSQPRRAQASISQPSISTRQHKLTAQTYKSQTSMANTKMEHFSLSQSRIGQTSMELSNTIQTSIMQSSSVALPIKTSMAQPLMSRMDRMSVRQGIMSTGYKTKMKPITGAQTSVISRREQTIASHSSTPNVIKNSITQTTSSQHVLQSNNRITPSEEGQTSAVEQGEPTNVAKLSTVQATRTTSSQSWEMSAILPNDSAKQPPSIVQYPAKLHYSKQWKKHYVATTSVNFDYNSKTTNSLSKYNSEPERYQPYPIKKSKESKSPNLQHPNNDQLNPKVTVGNRAKLQTTRDLTTEDKTERLQHDNSKCEKTIKSDCEMNIDYKKTRKPDVSNIDKERKTKKKRVRAEYEEGFCHKDTREDRGLFANQKMVNKHSNVLNYSENVHKSYQSHHESDKDDNVDYSSRDARNDDDDELEKKDAQELLISMSNRSVKISRLLEEQKRLMATLHVVKSSPVGCDENISRHNV